MRVLAGRYELLQVVGRGGMGEVWKGVDRELGRTVAVKVLPVELTRQEEFRQRFRREARTGAALSHQGVATLFDVGEAVEGDEAVPYLVMEYIDGRTLAEALRIGGLPPVARAVALARDVADTLVHSHGLGLIHRDIKPSNVMVTESGAVKVLDFGIAKALATTTTRLTATGLMVGTPAYLSPEQIDGGAVDGRTDVYSLGCLLYELLTGRPPFTGDSPFVVMNQHLTKVPLPPSVLRPVVPAEVDAVVLSALAKSPGQRYGDAAALRSALESAQRATAPAAVPAQPTVLSTLPSSALPAQPTPTPTPATPPALPTPAPATPPAVPTPAPTASAVPPALPGAPAWSPAEPALGPSRRDGDPTGSARSRSAWAVRFRFTETGTIAVLGWLFLLEKMVTGSGGWAVPVAYGTAAFVISLLALPWSARVSSAVSWAPVAQYAAAWHYSDEAVALATLPFVVLVPFAFAGLVRRRYNPALVVCLLWVALAEFFWALTLTTGGGPFQNVYVLVVLIVVAVIGWQEVADRRSPRAVP